MDWENHRNTPVLCRVQIRPTFDGRAMRPGLEGLNGREIQFVAAWFMSEHDPYPGEWALMPCPDVDDFGPAWIASGDVVPAEAQEGE